MQVFKMFMKIVKKRLRVSMIYIVVFIAIGITMAANGSSDSGFESSKLHVSVNDLDDTEASRALVDFIGKNHEIVEIENDKDSVLDAIYYRKADIVLTINEGYSSKLAEGITDGIMSDYRIPGSYTSEFIDTEINQYINMISAYTIGGMEVSDASLKAAEISEKDVKVEKINFSESSGSELDEMVSYYYQYLAYILIAVMISGLCPVILAATRKDIKNRTNCSCVSASSQTLQIVAGTAVFVIAVYAVLTTAAIIIYGAGEIFSYKGLLALLNGFVFLIFAMMLTLLIAVISPAEKVVNMIGNVVSLGMCFLCGVFVPQELLGDTVLSIGKFLPAYWYVKANNMLSGAGGEIFSSQKYLTCIGVELAFSAALLCVVLLTSKTKQSSKSI